MKQLLPLIHERSLDSDSNEKYARRAYRFVGHRLSTIPDADKIVVMNHGDVVETGKHRDLQKRWLLC